MATIRKLRGRWQAQVRPRGMKPLCREVARELELQVDPFGAGRVMHVVKAWSSHNFVI